MNTEEDTFLALKRTKLVVNTGRYDSIFNISAAEKHYKAKFVGTLPTVLSDGSWSEEPLEIFYQEVPPVEGYSHYVGIFSQNGKICVTSGKSAVEGIIHGMVAGNGEIIYSRYRHDYRVSSDNSVYVVGGRSYMNSGSALGNGRHISMEIINGNFYEIEVGE